MAYIGNTVQNQGFTPAIDYFNGNGVTVTFTLSRPVASVAQLIVAIDNVIQNPNTAFSVSGNSITFTSAPLSGTNNIWVEYTSLITTYAAISQDPSVIGDISATGGYLAEGDFGNTFIDGTIVDYVTGTARITTGPSDAIAFYNGGTNARNPLMTLGATGNVGIGTTSPAAPLSFSNAIGSVGDPNKIRMYDDGTQIYGIGISSSQQNYVVGAGGSHCFYSGNAGSTTERMRIGANGDVGIGLAGNSGVRLYVVGSNSLSTSWTIYTENSSGAVQFGLRNDNYMNAPSVANYPTTGTTVVINGSYIGYLSSSIRFKKDVVDYDKGLAEVEQLRPVSYRSSKPNQDGEYDERTYAGFIAEEVKELGLEEYIDYDQEGEVTSLKYAQMTALLCKAIQELKATVDAQAARIAALEGATK
jgi:hypothetical protein